jgi:SAM-dependent methyltransferase
MTTQTHNTAALLNAASAPYKHGGRFAYHFARGKISGDPAFYRILQAGYIKEGSHILDLGCGQGLTASLLDCAPALDAAGQWPSGWASPPQSFSYRGIDLMAFDVSRANVALSRLRNPAVAEMGDMCTADFMPTPTHCDVTIILDVLHYVPYAAQEDVLRRVFAATSNWGVMLLRVGDADAGLPFKISNWVDAVVTTIRGHRLSKLYYRPLSEWQALLTQIGFKVQAIPMSEGTLFANVMLLARK